MFKVIIGLQYEYEGFIFADAGDVIDGFLILITVVAIGFNDGFALLLVLGFYSFHLGGDKNE